MWKILLEIGLIDLEQRKIAAKILESSCQLVVKFCEWGPLGEISATFSLDCCCFSVNLLYSTLSFKFISVDE